MGRRKIEIKAIKDDRNRSVTFLKRKGGLFKKAHELSVLCSVDVAVIIFGHNKKLYEFSSGDIQEILGRYNYYGQPHEHKGPGDFTGRKDMDDDDDDDMGSPPMDDMPDQSMVPPQLQNQAAYQHMRQHQPSASPPMPNGNSYQRQHTPQPQQPLSRPNSRNQMRRPSSNLIPQQPHPHPMSQPPQTANGYAYVPNPSIYNPQAGAGMPVAPQPPHPSPFQYPPQPPQPPQQQQHPHPHPQAQNIYVQDHQRRLSLPPNFNQDRAPQRQNTTPPQAPLKPEPEHEPQPEPSPEVKRLAKSHSIFTPIDASRSVLAQHWISSKPVSRSNTLTSEPSSMYDGGRSQSIDVGVVGRNGRPQDPGPPPARPPQPHHPQRGLSTNSLPDIPTPARSDSIATQGGKRPRLKVQIPSEQSDGGSATAESSPRDSAGKSASARVTTEGSHSSGVVLPPPSPSAGSLLSAGATGPPNPFARPAPPTSNNQNSGNNLDTPMSALPSRFVDGLLPSPSSFYPEWNFGRFDSNVLPSPLNFQTPAIANGPSFLRDDLDRDGKRKNSEDDPENNAIKRVKV